MTQAIITDTLGRRWHVAMPKRLVTALAKAFNAPAPYGIAMALVSKTHVSRAQQTGRVVSLAQQGSVPRLATTRNFSELRQGVK